MFLFSFVLTFILIKIIIHISGNIQNPVRSFVPKTEEEKQKINPFGGIAIFLSAFITAGIFLPFQSLILLLPSILMLILGLFDDLKKILSKSYHGISTKQKLFFQSLIAIFVCFLAFYYNPNFANFVIIIPFYGVIELKFPILLSFVIAFLAFNGTVNAMNLADGLDGLAGKQALITLVFLFLLLNVVFTDITHLKSIVLIFIGGIIAFLFFNSNPASIFMGDAGSMALGSLIASSFIFLRLELMLPFVCFVLFIEALSVIIQVVYFKITKGKRIFKMSPLHHHFQLSGLKEQKITEVAFLISVLLVILFLISLI
jgi:phospho-N-acetylmuramoyl-pentapeptide-transferase